MKIAYFGLPLGALLLAQDGHELGPVVLSPVEAPGRRRLTRLFPALIDAAAEHSDLEAEVLERLTTEKAELLVSWFWTRKLPARWLTQPPLGAIGVHPSLLPRHRGPNPYFWSIDAGDDEAGVTVHRLLAEYDTGPMLGARSLPIGARDAWQLARALDRPSLGLLRETVARLSRGEVVPEAPQDERMATWAPEPTGEALHVDFGWTTERVLRRIRALSPTPGLALEVEGTPLFVTRAERAQDYLAALIAGEAHISGALSLRTADGAIQVTRAFFPETETEATDSAEVAALLKRGRPV
ncbi:MAG TPA: formyltransferase family protein [Polyangiaceae bacterium]|nr:formyltransferase family protein [Polyangiaceae bacterium]